MSQIRLEQKLKQKKGGKYIMKIELRYKIRLKKSKLKKVQKAK